MRWRELATKHEDRIAQLAAMSPHDLLGVTHNASAAEIKAAYVSLVKTYHPDKSDPFMARYNEQVIKLINAAYERLKSSP
jgi:curved DNA-binding protein CbpA